MLERDKIYSVSKDTLLISFSEKLNVIALRNHAHKRKSKTSCLIRIKASIVYVYIFSAMVKFRITFHSSVKCHWLIYLTSPL